VTTIPLSAHADSTSSEAVMPLPLKQAIERAAQVPAIGGSAGPMSLRSAHRGRRAGAQRFVLLIPPDGLRERGIGFSVAAETEHRVALLPLVLAGVGLAVVTSRGARRPSEPAHW
jgi:hypothetical protein